VVFSLTQKYAYHERLHQKFCLVGEKASDSSRYWASRDLGTESMFRTKFVPSFAE